MDTVRGVWVSPSGSYVGYHERSAAVGDKKENDVENDSQKKNKMIDVNSCPDHQPAIRAHVCTFATALDDSQQKKNNMMDVDSWSNRELEICAQCCTYAAALELDSNRGHMGGDAMSYPLLTSRLQTRCTAGNMLPNFRLGPKQPYILTS
jgi:hypothetical protein